MSDNAAQIVKIGLSAAVMALGVYGLNQGIDYSGWVLFIGCCGFVGFA